MTVGGVGMYSMAVALSSIQAEFGVDRAAATLPYTLTMVGFGLGGIVMGRLSDRFGVVVPVLLGAGCLGLGFICAGLAPNLPAFALAHGLLIGLGCSGTFAPLVADISMWFTRHRGIAVAVCASGNYLAGAVWPPLLNHYFDAAGWRSTYIGVGIFALAVALPLSALMNTHKDGWGGTMLIPNNIPKRVAQTCFPNQPPPGAGCPALEHPWP